MDGTTIDVLRKHIGWKSSAMASRFVEVTASAAASRGTKRPRDTAFIQADILPLSEGFGKSCASFSGDNQRQQNAEWTRLAIWDNKEDK